jgi:3',5'-cyclic-AMP phosphodiesterase
MLIAQLTDLHITSPDGQVYGCVDTRAYLQAAIARLHALTPRPDLVLITGDLVDHGSADEYAHLRDLLTELQIPVFMSIGNHDNRDVFLDVFGDLDYLKHVTQFINYAVDMPKLRLLALDTHVAGKPYGELAPETLEWVEKELTDHPTRPTLLFMHHPPFESGIWWMDAIGLHGGAALERIIRAHPQVRRVVCGHAHRAIFTEWAGVMCSIAPSTAHHIELDLAGDAFLQMRIEPPTLHLHRIAPDGRIVTHSCPVAEPGPRFLPLDHIHDDISVYESRLRVLLARMRGEPVAPANDVKGL